MTLVLIQGCSTGAETADPATRLDELETLLLSADLELEGGLPAVRQQVVQFPGGEMRVVERYYRFIAR